MSFRTSQRTCELRNEVRNICGQSFVKSTVKSSPGWGIFHSQLTQGPCISLQVVSRHPGIYTIITNQIKCPGVFPGGGMVTPGIDSCITSAERSRKNDQRQMSRGHAGFQENTSDDRPRKNEQRQKDRKTVIIAGDSMIQHVHGWEMSNTEVSVAVKSFSGARIDDMNDFLQPIIRRSPDEIILHIGTNNIKGNDSPEVLAAGISRLASMITKKSPNTKVAISGLIVRKGLNLKDKVCKQVVEINLRG